MASKEYMFTKAIDPSVYIPFGELLKQRNQWATLAIFNSQPDQVKYMLHEALLLASAMDHDEEGVNLVFLLMEYIRHVRYHDLMAVKPNERVVDKEKKLVLAFDLVDLLKGIWEALPKFKNGKCHCQTDIDAWEYRDEQQPAMQATKAFVIGMLVQAWADLPGSSSGADDLLLWLTGIELRFEEQKLMERALRDARISKKAAVYSLAYILRDKPSTPALNAIVEVFALVVMRCMNSEEMRTTFWQFEQFGRLSGTAQKELSLVAERMFCLDVLGRELCEVLKKHCSEILRPPISYLVEGEARLVLEVYRCIPRWHRNQNSKLDEYLEEYLKMKKALEEPTANEVKNCKNTITVTFRYRAGYGDNYTGTGDKLEIEKEARII